MSEIMRVINGEGILDGVEDNANEENGEDEDGEEGQEPAADPEPEVTDQASWKLLRESFDSTYSMIQAFLEDHELNVKCRMLILAGKPLKNEYSAALKYQEDGQFAMVTWQAKRAAGQWFATIPKLLALLESGEAVNTLDLRPLILIEQADPRYRVLQERLSVFTTFVMELCHARCWSQLHHSFCLPNVFVRTTGKCFRLASFGFAQRAHDH